MIAATSTTNVAIGKLQSACEATRVPGELREWLTNLRESLCDVRRVLSGESLLRHRSDFKEISKDLSLVPKVAQMRTEDADLLIAVRNAEALSESAMIKLDRSADQEEDVLALTDLGKVVHSIVIRLRAQEQAIETWYLEAINRDEGVAG